MEQLRRCIVRLSPHKAPREDGIPNIVIKELLELIAEYLLKIFRATFTLCTYRNHWQVWDTIVLCKPGKPRYDIPKAHRTIALMNTLGKLLSAIVAEDLSFMCEHYALLPDNHFGSRPGRCTTDTMHLLVHRIKAAWHRHNVAAILFLDVKGAFPNAVSARLLHNMHMCRVPEEYIPFVDHLLTNQCMRLKFDGYTSDWITVDNGIVQGDPLSMILYLFYNLDLLEDVGKPEMKVGYIDDVNFFAEGPALDVAYAKLSDMVTRDGGSQDWSKQHTSKFEMLKLTLVGFSRRRMRDPARPRKMIAETRPSLSICGTDIKPVESHKFLGVVFDQELHWNVQVKRTITKATKWTLVSHCQASSWPTTNVPALSSCCGAKLHLCSRCMVHTGLPGGGLWDVQRVNRSGAQALHRTVNGYDGHYGSVMHFHF